VRQTVNQFKGGGRFDLTVASGVVTKRGDVPSLAREALGLRRAAGLGIAPRLVAAQRGVIVTEFLDGTERALDTMGPPEAHELGSMVRRLHDSRRTATGGRPRWPSRARSLTSYRRLRASDALAAAGPDRRLAERIIAALPPLRATSARQPFRLLHGDLVAANIIWTPAPRLVDFEFWRMGDPAEDLAYLIELNALPPGVVSAVLDGYADARVAERIDSWRALCALDAGLWYRNAAQPERATALIERAARSIAERIGEATGWQATPAATPSRSSR
jgi:aminoglycoside phosphotransferase (APT) family kinase protein